MKVALDAEYAENEKLESLSANRKSISFKAVNTHMNAY